MKEETTFVSLGSDISKTLRKEAYNLFVLAENFAGTGNFTVARTLSSIGDSLETQAQAVSDLVGERVDSELKRAQEHTGNMLKACLAGAMLAQQEGES